MSVASIAYDEYGIHPIACGGSRTWCDWTLYRAYGVLEMTLVEIYINKVARPIY